MTIEEFGWWAGLIGGICFMLIPLIMGVIAMIFLNKKSIRLESLRFCLAQIMSGLKEKVGSD